MKDRSRQIDRYFDGSLDADETAELFAWLAESRQNAEVFARQSLLDQQLGELLEGGLVEALDTTEADDKRAAGGQARLRRGLERLMWAGGLAAAILILFWLAILLVESKGEVTELRYALELARREAARAGAEESTTIHFYIQEHQEIMARHASLDAAQAESVQMRVSQEDMLYYERLDGQPEMMRPGIIVRGPLSQGHLSTAEAPVISNGQTLSLSEARETADFDLLAPAWLDPGFALDEIRRIEGRDAMQLLYTNGIDSVSLFEQPLEGRRGLSRQEFREYAVYSNGEQGGGTILAWRDSVRSYVLIGKVELSQLMDMAQSISNGR